MSVITPCALLPQKHTFYMHEMEEENGQEYKSKAKKGQCAEISHV